MKRVYIIAFALFIIMLCSCENEKSRQAQLAAEYSDNKFSYELNDVTAFTVCDDTVYAVFKDSDYVYAYDRDGEKTSELFIGGGYHSNLCFDGERLYAFTFSEKGEGITVIDIQKNESAFYAVNIPIPISMAVSGGGIFIIYCDDVFDPYLESVKFRDDDNYFYFGEKAVCVDKETFGVSDVPLNNVIGLKKCGDSEIIYYAYDDIGGYYFTRYSTESGTFSEKIYNNSAQKIFSFDFIPENGSVVYSDFSNRKLVSAPMAEDDCCIDFMCDIVAVNGNDLQYHNGSVYILDGVSGNIIRTDYKKSVKDNTEIKILSPEIYSEVPYGCGYRINSRMLSDDEFALSILAGNTDYDICMMTSAQPFSQNIRDKGAFYPLNDVPGVREYLDRCFPYIGEAAVNSDGEIWMLPISIDVPCIIYSPENCGKNGIVFNESITWQYLFDTARRIYQSEELRDKYQLNEYQAASDILSRYNSYYAFSGDKPSYNNELFRSVCAVIRENAVSSESLHTRIISYSQYADLTQYYGEYLFELMPWKFSLDDAYPYEILRAVPTPSLNGYEKGCAECTYFCVNSNSGNLSAALDFISTYCSYMATRNYSFMLEDETVYPYCGSPLSHDMYNIYSDAQVTFELPTETFWDDYIRYRNGDIGIDELVGEIERKTDMHINE